MGVWVYFFQELPFYPGYFVMMMMMGLLYIPLIGPLIFNFWVKPKIERRHNMYLKPDRPIFVYDYLLFPHWGMPVIEVSIYIFCKYMNWDFWFIRKPNEGTYYSQLKKMNYDIAQASRAEIIVSMFSVVILAATLISFAVFGYYLYTH